ncbi:hypothetical protein [Succinivibrio dextrinosolvens]|uniref:hypothetical protein n=1 Tax=Succinivibrio dextrinosolvens TaxID=83771 RepID=UPI0015A6A542|nr:hypothetical protein [Succinivibrio dextrinosolvens]
MYSTALDIAKSFFPFGSGCGSFGSSISGEYYSFIYYLYGINEKIPQDSYETLSDSQLPYYLGQFGMFGVCLYLLVIILFFKYSKSIFLYSYNKYKSVYLMFAYIAIASLVESILTNESGSTIALSLIFCEKNLIKHNKLSYL